MPDRWQHESLSTSGPIWRRRCLLLAAVALPSTSPADDLAVTLPGGAPATFVWIEPGTFTMGVVGEHAVDSEHLPLVTITSGFYLQKDELTMRQWESVMSSQPWVQQAWHGHPVPHL